MKSVFAFLSGTHCETFAFRDRLNQLCKLLKHIFANKVGGGGGEKFPLRISRDWRSCIVAATLYIKPKQHNSHLTPPLGWAHPLQGIARGSHGGAATAKLTWTVRRQRIKGEKWCGLMLFPNCPRAVEETVNVQGKRSVKATKQTATNRNYVPLVIRLSQCLPALLPELRFQGFYFLFSFTLWRLPWCLFRGERMQLALRELLQLLLQSLIELRARR